ncbi:MAG: hypothetical protein ACKVPX_18275 [Myxococcaceae bacterium]
MRVLPSGLSNAGHARQLSWVTTPRGTFRLALENHGRAVPWAQFEGVSAIACEGGRYQPADGALLDLVLEQFRPNWGEVLSQLMVRAVPLYQCDVQEPSPRTPSRAVDAAAMGRNVGQVALKKALAAASRLADARSEQASLWARVRNRLCDQLEKSLGERCPWTLRNLVMAQKATTVLDWQSQEGSKRPEVALKVGSLHEPGLMRCLEMSTSERLGRIDDTLRSLERIGTAPSREALSIICRLDYEETHGAWRVAHLEDPFLVQLKTGGALAGRREPRVPASAP